MLHSKFYLTGATKSGKTVLARKNLPKENAIWVSRGQVSTAADLWNKILDVSDSFNEITTVESYADSLVESNKIDGSVKVAGTGGGVEHRSSESSTDQFQQSASRTTNPIFVATKFLVETKIPLVIDDFHYISPEVQVQIVRALKECVFDGVPVIIIAVPHRAYDAVRVEKEMTERVQQLEIPPWQSEDLSKVAGLGFDALQLRVEDLTISRLIQESFSSPHIVQEFCLSICRKNKIRETSIDGDNVAVVNPPKAGSNFSEIRLMRWDEKNLSVLLEVPGSVLIEK